MFSLLFALVQQILKDQGIDPNSKEMDLIRRRLCPEIRKAKFSTVNVSNGSESLSALIFLLFSGDYSKNKTEMKNSIVKRISRAAENLSSDFSVIKGDNSLFMKVYDEERDHIIKLSKSSVKTISIKQLQHIIIDLGANLRSKEKFFKYSDFNKTGNYQYQLLGLDTLDYFELAVDMFANSINFVLPIGVSLTLDLDMLGEGMGSKTSNNSRGKKLNGDLLSRV